MKRTGYTIAAWLIASVIVTSVPAAQPPADPPVDPPQAVTPPENEKQGAADPNHPFACTVVLGDRQFTLRFPVAPKRTIVQESQHVTATHDQARYRGVQYNASVYQFKDRDFTTDQARKAFFEEYLAGRAMFASGNKLQKKFRLFRGQPAAVFKHPLDLDGVESHHHGIIFFVENTFVALTSVHPAQTEPDPSFETFFESFRILTPPAPTP